MNKKITAVAVVALAALAGAGVAGARMMLYFTMNGNRQTLEDARGGACAVCAEGSGGLC